MFGIPDSIKFKPLAAGVKAQLNRFIAEYGTVESVDIHRDVVRLSLRLVGISHPVDVEMRTFRIAPDGTSIELGGYGSSVPFVAEALNRHFARTVNVADPKARAVLVLAARLLA
jgi:hypothetical protein